VGNLSYGHLVAGHCTLLLKGIGNLELHTVVHKNINPSFNFWKVQLTDTHNMYTVTIHEFTARHEVIH